MIHETAWKQSREYVTAEMCPEWCSMACAPPHWQWCASRWTAFSPRIGWTWLKSDTWSPFRAGVLHDPAGDFMKVYQHACHPHGSTSQSSKRAAFDATAWGNLESHFCLNGSIRTVPLRNTSMLLGDFNTSSFAASNMTGPGLGKQLAPAKQKRSVDFSRSCCPASVCA